MDELYLWNSPDDRYRNQIKYTTIKSRWKFSVLNIKTYPRAEYRSDHQLAMENLRLRLKRMNRTRQNLKPIQNNKKMEMYRK